MRAPAVFHGTIKWDELSEWYAAADMCVPPSVLDALPRVMLEAMACGAPFVGTTGTGMADHVQPGRNGLLCDPHSTASVADAIQTMIENPALDRRMGAEAPAYTERTFAWPRVGGQLFDAIVAAVLPRALRRITASWAPRALLVPISLRQRTGEE